ncbi:MAG: YdeI/OmpD-associated family protein [Burkholderiales bacterium]
MNKSPAVDAYIAKSTEFAQPIMTKLRALMHKACPQIIETMKWSAPFYEYKGVVAYSLAFKQHVRFGFWKQKLLDVPPSMRGKKFQSVADLPPDAVLIRCIKAAVALNEVGAKVPRAPRKKRPPPKPPADLLAAFGKNAKARAAFDSFTPSQQREYVEWITDAKREETRSSRLEQSVQWMAQGKTRFWKYQDC